VVREKRSAGQAIANVTGKVVREAARKLAAVVEPPLPEDRPTLLALHAAARRRRDAAPLDSHERAEAAFQIERIEVHIARVERAMDPPQM
jgi:hypothetical protein